MNSLWPYRAAVYFYFVDVFVCARLNRCAKFFKTKRICKKSCSLSARYGDYYVLLINFFGCKISDLAPPSFAQDSLGEEQKLKLEIARIIREDFLNQNSFTSFDYTCPLLKTIGMLSKCFTFILWAHFLRSCLLRFRSSDYSLPVSLFSCAECIVTFYESAQKAIAATANSDVKLTFNKIQKTLEAEWVSLTTMKFINPELGEDQIVQEFAKRRQDILSAYAELQQM